MRMDSAVADRLTAIVLFLIGLASTWGGFVMDRLEIRQIHPASIPGLVPMILGFALMICAGALAWSARTPRGDAAANPNTSASAFAVTLVWSALYALVAVGNMPFAIATMIYVAGFTLWFLWAENGQRPDPIKIILVVVFSIAIAIGISVLFRDGFLVRLP